MSAAPLDPVERNQALAACPVFSGVPAADLGVFAEMLETEWFPAGTVLFEKGDPSDRVYLVARGRLSAHIPGRPGPVRSLGAGDLLGEYGMFVGRVRTASVRAETDAVLLSVDEPRFRAFLMLFPQATLVLLKTAVERLVAAEAAHRAREDNR
jgi:NTE family protein